jgi:hypothetical protein
MSGSLGGGFELRCKALSSNPSTTKKKVKADTRCKLKKRDAGQMKVIGYINYMKPIKMFLIGPG